MYTRLFFVANCDAHALLAAPTRELIIKMSSVISLMVSIVSNMEHCTERSLFFVHV